MAEYTGPYLTVDLLAEINKSRPAQLSAHNEARRELVLLAATLSTTFTRPDFYEWGNLTLDIEAISEFGYISPEMRTAGDEWLRRTYALLAMPPPTTSSFNSTPDLSATTTPEDASLLQSPLLQTPPPLEPIFEPSVTITAPAPEIPDISAEFHNEDVVGQEAHPPPLEEAPLPTNGTGKWTYDHEDKYLIPQGGVFTCKWDSCNRTIVWDQHMTHLSDEKEPNHGCQVKELASQRKLSCLWGGCKTVEPMSLGSLVRHINDLHLGAMHMECSWCGTNKRRDAYGPHHGPARYCPFRPAHLPPPPPRPAGSQIPPALTRLVRKAAAAQMARAGTGPIRQRRTRVHRAQAQQHVAYPAPAPAQVPRNGPVFGQPSFFPQMTNPIGFPMAGPSNQQRSFGQPVAGPSSGPAYSNASLGFPVGYARHPFPALQQAGPSRPSFPGLYQGGRFGVPFPSLQQAALTQAPLRAASQAGPSQEPSRMPSQAGPSREPSRTPSQAGLANAPAPLRAPLQAAPAPRQVSAPISAYSGPADPFFEFFADMDHMHQPTDKHDDSHNPYGTWSNDDAENQPPHPSFDAQ